jgi:hypothetical protein
LLSSSQLSSFSNSCHNINLDSRKQVGLHDVNLLSILICGNKNIWWSFVRKSVKLLLRGVPEILLENRWFMSCGWFSRIRDQLALFLEIRSSLFSLSFTWSRDDFERLSPRDVENVKRHSSKTLLENLILDSVFVCRKRDQIWGLGKRLWRESYISCELEHWPAPNMDLMV